MNTDVIKSMMETIQQLQSKLKDEKEKNEKLSSELNQITAERKCSNHHSLKPTILDDELYDMQEVEIQCNKCKKAILPNFTFWRCNMCNYDQCLKCGGYSKVYCPFSHKLEEIGYEPDFLCNVCAEKIKEERYGCSCLFDICKKCYDV